MQKAIDARRREFDGAGVRLVADEWEPRARPRGTVVLLHGGGQTRHSWRGAGERLAERGWRAFALDSRGHGESEWAADGDYSARSQVADLHRVIGQIGGRPVLVGASMGGMTSLLFTGEHPDSAGGLVLVDVTPRLHVAGVREIADFMTAGIGGFDSVESAAHAVAAYRPGRDRPPNTSSLMRNLRRRDDGRFYWHWDPRLLPPGDLRDVTRDQHTVLIRAAERVRVPTLVIHGMQSHVVSDDGVAELLGAIPGSEAVGISDAGHMITGDDNDMFENALTDFLERTWPGEDE